MVNQLKAMVLNSDNIVFFGGAGTSTESNIPDFRSSEGLFNTYEGKGYRPEEILSMSFFAYNTEEFYRFYRSKMIHKNAKPNAAHYTLAHLEKKGKLKAVITQNIDGLHQMAGSKNVIELHGSIHRNYCMECYENYSLEYIINSETTVPKCIKCQGTIKPDVVLYEESLDMYVVNQAIKYISNADVLIVGGTSLTVYPAAGLLNYYNGDKLILINKTSTIKDSQAKIIINDSIGKTLETLMDIL